MDTAPAFSGKGVTPIIHENYDGGDVVLPKDDCVIRVADFPELPSLKGRTLITTDGSTLLGADNKAGVAEIMTLCEELIASGEPHGKICVGFTRTRRSEKARIILTCLPLAPNMPLP